MSAELTMLKEITEAPGVSGFEGEVRKVVARYLDPVAQRLDDNLGSLIYRKRGNADAPKIMLAGHMDEIGFMVKSITHKGFIRFQTLGGWFDQVLLAQRVTVFTSRGTVPGVIGSKPPHLLTPEERDKVVRKTDMFIDIGAASREEAVEVFGVRPGDPIVPYSHFTRMANDKLLMARAWDDRVGCALVIDVLRRLAAEDHPNVVYGVGTVQEEVGLRGATTSTEVVGPDVGFALETSIANDMLGFKEDEITDRLGGGPSLVLYDASMIPHLKLRDLVIETARQEGIPLQMTTMDRGGTDAGRMHIYRAGVPSVVIGVPARYIHSHWSIIHHDDYLRALDLVVALVKRLDDRTVARLKGLNEGSG